jgi:hypothetical protein
VLTPDHILALAANPSLVRQVRSLARPDAWQVLGREGDILWGVYSHYSKTFFYTQVYPQNLTFACTCTSLHQPCAHALALFLLGQEQSPHFPATPSPTPLQPFSAARPRPLTQSFNPNSRHLTRLTVVWQMFDTWLTDAIRDGLAHLPARPKSFWDNMVHRLIDAQAGEIARELRQWPVKIKHDPDWPSALLAQMGRWHLLAQGFHRFATLSDATQADLLQAAGGTTRPFAQALTVTDNWLVLSRTVEQDGQQRRLRLWLWGETNQRLALFTESVRGRKPFSQNFIPGMTLPATLVYLPGSTSLRAVFTDQSVIYDASIYPHTSPFQPHATAIAEAYQNYTTALAHNPWLDLYPFLIGPVLPYQQEGQWFLQDAQGDCLPLPDGFNLGWSLLALSRGRGLIVFGEWNGQQLRPLAVQNDNRWLSLLLLRPVPAPKTAPRHKPGYLTDLHPWPELVQAALVGAERATLPVLPADLPVPTTTTPEKQLLEAAAAFSLYQQVGQLPQMDRSLPPSLFHTSAPVTTTSPSPYLLACILDGQFRDCLGEYLGLMVQAGQTIPPELLPNLLEEGRTRPTLRPQLLPVLGERGRWLARQNPLWAYASPVLDDWDGLVQHWQDGDHRVRHALLYQLRHSEPERGREIAAAFWKEEQPQHRTWYLSVMAHGLSMADEPLLETLLDDRHHLVRQKAAELLACLPQSRLARRMAARLPQIVSWQPATPQRLYLRYPDTRDPHLQRDGFSLLDNPKNQSKALITLLNAVPLSAWLTLGPTTPTDLVTALPHSQWVRTLTNGLVTATLRQHNTEWADCLLVHLPLTLVTAKLAACLPVARLESFLRPLAQKIPLHKDHPLLLLLRQWPHPWSQDMAHLWLHLLAETMAQAENTSHPDSLLSLSLPNFAKQCPPTLADDAAALLLPLAADNPAWSRAIIPFVTTLRFRKRMIEEIG